MTLWIVRIILATLFVTITAALIDSIIARLSPGARTSRR